MRGCSCHMLSCPHYDGPQAADVLWFDFLGCLWDKFHLLVGITRSKGPRPMCCDLIAIFLLPALGSSEGVIRAAVRTQAGHCSVLTHSHVLGCRCMSMHPFNLCSIMSCASASHMGFSIHTLLIPVLLFPSQSSACRNTCCKSLPSREKCLHKGRNALFSSLRSALYQKDTLD